MNVAIRTDSSTHIGSGHVMRCLALAEELRSAGHRVVFLSRQAQGDLRDLVAREYEFEVRTLSVSSTAMELGVASAREQIVDSECTIDLINGELFDWLIVDHYSLDLQWERRVREHVAHTLVIDDLANRPHECDILVDHNHLLATRYLGLVPSDCELLIGPRFALLRREFYGTAAERKVPSAPKTILISFGGTDPSNYTEPTLHAVRNLDLPGTAIEVVTGHDHPQIETLRHIEAKSPDVTVHEHVTGIAPILARADLAIGAGGVAALERLSVGLPSIVLAVAQNQETVAEALARDGLIYYLGPASDITTHKLQIAISALCNQPLRQAMSNHGREFVDGDGTRRILRRMQSYAPVEIREAQPHDSRMAFDWRNHPAVRASSFDPRELSWNRHEEWFTEALSNPNRHLLIGVQNETAIGVIRYDVDPQTASAEVSIYLDPNRTGEGLGQPFLRAGDAWLATHDRRVTEIVSRIRIGNPASHRLFEVTGYQPHHSTLIKRLQHEDLQENIV